VQNIRSLPVILTVRGDRSDGLFIQVAEGKLAEMYEWICFTRTVDGARGIFEGFKRGQGIFVVCSKNMIL